MPGSDAYYSFMLDHAAGNLSPGLDVAAGLHRLLCLEGQKTDEIWDSVRRALEIDEFGLDEQMPDRDLKAKSVLDLDLPKVRWRRGLSGVRFADCGVSGGKLMQLLPGQRVFRHGHSALEATVVLDGTLDDGLGVFEPGDIVIAGPHLKHRPSAHGNSACTCFVARERTPIWRFT